MSPCILCGDTASSIYYQDKHHYFFECSLCSTVYRNAENFIDHNAEKERYLTHNNDVDNLGYQRFVRPIIKAVTKEYTTTHIGLDFGAGTGPVITKLLSDQGYTLALYDPFFHPDKTVLEQQYDFIVCCEVIEHFHNPMVEFRLLKSLLKPNGKLFCMTDVWEDGKEAFAKWYYKNDPTHVIFYNAKNIQYIKNTVGFRNSIVDGRLITFMND